MKTSELTGAALDWAVAKALGHKVSIQTREEIIARDPEMDEEEKAFHRTKPARVRIEHGPCPKYATDWSQGGPIIEREKIAVDILAFNDQWTACKKQPAFTPACRMHGPTPLTAAMRTYVASKMGDEVDVPKELK
jgi:hypothetical protein